MDDPTYPAMRPGEPHGDGRNWAARMVERLTSDAEPEELGDFTATPRMILLSVMAIGIGAFSAFVALALLRLIGLVTNIAFYQRWDTALVAPGAAGRSIWIVIVPVVGGLIVGLMARYGSEKIRGHGIPEAIEAILIGGSRVQPEVALLKPVSSAIAIGTGGPFGAEGPIIMTGGAVGSLFAQFLHLTNAERKTLLIAGAAGGMAAVFASPVAATMLAVEVMLFEWKPRSLIPVALASATSMWVRMYLLGQPPVFPAPPHSDALNFVAVLGCVGIGIVGGALAALLTEALYATEDAYRKLPIHWMWWPVIGGLVIGIGGLIYPRALGVGYDVIGDELAGHVTAQLILGILLVKSTIWVISLSSGTSGGVLAPVLMMGGAMGAMASGILPDMGPGYWPMVAMGATFGGIMRAPLTGILFAIELTHDINMMLPLTISTAVAYGFTVLMLRRSILTEKVARRGYHLSAEYAVDPLEVLLVKEAMRTNIVTIPAGTPLTELARFFQTDRSRRKQGLYPVVDTTGHLRGVVTRTDIIELQADQAIDGHTLADIITRNPVVAYPDEPLRAVVYRMAEDGVTRLPVVERHDPSSLVGLVSLAEVLKARRRSLDDERRRERVLRVHRLFPGRGRVAAPGLQPRADEPPPPPVKEHTAAR